MDTQDAWKNKNLTVLQTFYQTFFESHFSRLILSVLCHLSFLHPQEPLNHGCLYALKQLLFTFFFVQPKILVRVINIWVVNRVNVFWAKHEHLFSHQFPAYIVYNNTCFVCQFNVKFKRNFDSLWYNYMISWTMPYLDINVLISICYIWHIDFGHMFSLAFESELCPMFYHGI